MGKNQVLGILRDSDGMGGRIHPHQKVWRYHVMDAVRAMGEEMAELCSILERDLRAAADVEIGFCGVVLDGLENQVLSFRPVLDQLGIPYRLGLKKTVPWRYRVVKHGRVMKQGYLRPAEPIFSEPCRTACRPGLCLPLAPTTWLTSSSIIWCMTWLAVALLGLMEQRCAGKTGASARNGELRGVRPGPRRSSGAEPENAHRGSVEGWAN